MTISDEDLNKQLENNLYEELTKGGDNGFVPLQSSAAVRPDDPEEMQAEDVNEFQSNIASVDAATPNALTPDAMVSQMKGIKESTTARIKRMKDSLKAAEQEFEDFRKRQLEAIANQEVSLKMVDAAIKAHKPAKAPAKRKARKPLKPREAAVKVDAKMEKSDGDDSTTDTTAQPGTL